MKTHERQKVRRETEEEEGINSTFMCAFKVTNVFVFD